MIFHCSGYYGTENRDRKWPFTTLLHFLVHQSPFNRFNLKDSETEKNFTEEEEKQSFKSKNILQSGISSDLERGE